MYFFYISSLETFLWKSLFICVIVWPFSVTIPATRVQSGLAKNDRKLLNVIQSTNERFSFCQPWLKDDICSSSYRNISSCCCLRRWLRFAQVFDYLLLNCNPFGLAGWNWAKWMSQRGAKRDEFANAEMPISAVFVMLKALLLSSPKAMPVI